MAPAAFCPTGALRRARGTLQVLKTAAATSLAASSSFVDGVKHLLDRQDADLKVADLEATIGLLADKRREVQQVQDANSLQLLLLFLQHARWAAPPAHAGLLAPPHWPRCCVPPLDALRDQLLAPAHGAELG